MYYELRRYTTTTSEARAFQAGFASELLPALEEAGFRLIGSWTVEIGDGSGADLLWLLQWGSLAEREQAYNIVRADPRNDEFRRRHAGSLVSVTSTLLKPTDFSPLK